MSQNRNKVLLIFPPFHELAFGDKWKENPSLTPPLGLMYLATPLINDGFDVDFIDLNIDRLTRKEFEELIQETDFVGISCYSESLRNVEKLIELIRRTKETVYILCGGPYCNFSKNHVNGSDLTAIGEAEDYISKILQLVIANESLEEIPGIIYRKNGRLIRNEGTMIARDINISKPALLQLAKHKNYGYGSTLHNMIGITTSRGCPFACTYCTHKGILKYRAREVENVIEEIVELSKNGYKYFFFVDDNFLMNKERAARIMDEIIKRNIKIKIFLQGRVDSADPGLYRKLKKAGVMMIMFGIESANQDVLDYYNKHITIEKIKTAINLTNKVGIISLGYFIIGAPMETLEHFANDKRMMNDYHIDIPFINILRYEQGTEIWDIAHKRGVIRKDETMVLANRRLSNFTFEELSRIREEILREIYTDPRRIARIAYKSIRNGELSSVLKLALQLNGNYLKTIGNPFGRKKAAKLVVQSRHGVGEQVSI